MRNFWGKVIDLLALMEGVFLLHGGSELKNDASNAILLAGLSVRQRTAVFFFRRPNSVSPNLLWNLFHSQMPQLRKLSNAEKV